MVSPVACCMLVIKTAWAYRRRAKGGDLPFHKEKIDSDVSKPRCYTIEYNEVNRSKDVAQGGRTKMATTWIERSWTGNIMQKNSEQVSRKIITVSKEPK